MSPPDIAARLAAPDEEVIEIIAEHLLYDRDNDIEELREFLLSLVPPTLH